MLLGCIGDDFTGSSDLANTLAKQGMRTVQYTGIPKFKADNNVEVGVVSLKTRSINVSEAINQSIEALTWLKDQGCKQFFFKYCSTFDSTPEGNIGPVIDALAEELDSDCVIVCPAFPGAGRTLYNGHLFVNDRLLNESGMQNHPLTPMTDPDIRRCLKEQTNNIVKHIPSSTVFKGSEEINVALRKKCKEGRTLVVVDAIRDEDLIAIGEASSELKLITGGSGVALGLPENFRKQGLIDTFSSSWKGEKGRCAILSGSCSIATRGQLKRYAENHPTLELQVSKVISGETNADAVCNWIEEQAVIPLVYSSADPTEVKRVQKEFGIEASATAIETLFSEIAKTLKIRGFNRLIVAGGETSGAVIKGLDLNSMEVGAEIDPGVPAMRANAQMVIALKSGNFGSPDFFNKAIKVLESSI